MRIIWLEHAVRDVRHAWRTIVRMPLLAAVVILSLGVGIGVNVVVFSWLQAIVLKPLPGVADARAFYLIEPRAETGSNPGASWLDTAISANASACSVIRWLFAWFR